MVEVSLALLISALAAIGVLRENLRVQTMENANIEADTIDQYRIALQNYADDAYQDIQRNLPVTRNGVTLPVGAGLGQTMQPTVAQLVALQYLPAGFPAGPTLSDNGTFQNRILRTPAGCVTIACNIEGLAWVSTPYYIRGTETTTRETNGPVISQILSRLGGYGGTSIDGFTANLTSSGGVGMGPNPLPGAPAGVVAVKFGMTASNLLQFVRLGDVRDPNLLGNLTVAGNLAAGGNTALTGTLTVAGATRLDGFTQVNNNLNVTGLTTLGGATTINAPTTMNGLLTVNAGITATGRVAGNTFVPTGIFSEGAACADDGAIGKSATGMLVCSAGVWRPSTKFSSIGAPCVDGTTAMGPPPQNIGLLCVNSVFRGMDTIIYTGAENTPCPVEGRTAQTPAGTELICKDGFYWSTAALFGRQGVQALNVYAHGQSVPGFTCPGGLQPRLIPMGVIAACSFGANAGCSNATGAFQGTINGSGVVSIVGSDGSTPAGGGTAQLTVASVCSTY